MIPRPCFQALHTVSFQFCYMFARSDTYFRLQLLLIIITTTCISLSLRRTSAPIHLTSVLGVLGTQESFCIVIAGLLERDIFDLLLPEFDKPWVIHLRETCCYSTNLCTWRPNTVYKNRRVRRHQAATPPGARPAPGPHPPMARAPWSTSDAAPSPIKTPRREKPEHPITFPETHPDPPPSTRDREGPEALLGTLPERGITIGGLLHHHACLRRDE
jgi:hypothetical protein